jgi:hypothetical protein
MTKDRLLDLAQLKFEKEFVNNIDINKIIDKFGRVKNRR